MWKGCRPAGSTTWPAQWGWRGSPSRRCRGSALSSMRWSRRGAAGRWTSARTRWGGAARWGWGFAGTCCELVGVVRRGPSRPLDIGPSPLVWVDALSMKVREGGRVCNTAVLVATACNADGHRELLGLELGSAEDG